MRHALLALICALAAPAYGQSTATVTTSGSGQRVLVDQSDAEGSSVSIEQIGVGGGVLATQQGTNARLALTMNGDDQEHSIAQRSAGLAAITINSFGDRNSSSIVQDVLAGASGEIALLQTGAENRAEMVQTTLADSGNSMFLNQNGNHNTARLVQDGGNNVIDLTQQGDRLEASVAQYGSGLTFTMTQTGGNTPIAVTQTGSPQGAGLPFAMTQIQAAGAGAR